MHIDKGRYDVNEIDFFFVISFNNYIDASSMVERRVKKKYFCCFQLDLSLNGFILLQFLAFFFDAI